VSDELAGRSAGLGVGSSGFVATHGLHTDAQRDAAREVVRQIGDADLRTVRLVVVDQHGIPRAKYLSGDALVSALENGSDFSGAIYSLDSANGVFPPAFHGKEFIADVVAGKATFEDPRYTGALERLLDLRDFMPSGFGGSSCRS